MSICTNTMRMFSLGDGFWQVTELQVGLHISSPPQDFRRHISDLDHPSSSQSPFFPFVLEMPGRIPNPHFSMRPIPTSLMKENSLGIKRLAWLETSKSLSRHPPSGMCTHVEVLGSCCILGDSLIVDLIAIEVSIHLFNLARIFHAQMS